MRIVLHEGDIDPSFQDAPWEVRWEGPDGGLISSWLRGREKARENPDLASAAREGQLIVLPWRGGVGQAIKGVKYGTFLYLAMWQGLRGESLEIDTGADLTLRCARTGVSVTYTSDHTRFTDDE